MSDQPPPEEQPLLAASSPADPAIRTPETVHASASQPTPLSAAIPQQTTTSPAKQRKKYQQMMAPMDYSKYLEPKKKKLAITALNWDREGRLGQTRKLDEDDVNDRYESLKKNPPQGDDYLNCTVWIDEGIYIL